MSLTLRSNSPKFVEILWQKFLSSYRVFLQSQNYLYVLSEIKNGGMAFMSSTMWLHVIWCWRIELKVLSPSSWWNILIAIGNLFFLPAAMSDRRLFRSPVSSTLKMEAVYRTEKSVNFYHATRNQNPEGGDFQLQKWWNLFYSSTSRSACS